MPQNLPPIIVWFREDLRLEDNPAFHHAVISKHPIIPIFIADPKDSSFHGEAKKWWLRRSLNSLAKAIKNRTNSGGTSGKLLLQCGDYENVLVDIARHTQAKACYYNALHTPFHKSNDDLISKSLARLAVTTKCFPSPSICNPEAIEQRFGKISSVFTPFWKKTSHQALLASPLNTPTSHSLFYSQSHSQYWDKNPTIYDILGDDPLWAKKFHDLWEPGRTGALLALHDIQSKLANYDEKRNYPATEGTSRLSAHLNLGDISPREIIYALRDISEYTKRPFVRQLAWREFHIHLMIHFPHLITQDFKDIFQNIPWRFSQKELQAWQKGQTGYPLVDAGMRQLYATGWMHNRVRMVVASFLCKHLLMHWSHGAKWFFDTLVDACLANNSAGWQWVAGSGADAAPYFRVFNPILQSQKFDPQGTYVKRWVHELRDLPPELLHDPWQQLSPQKVKHYHPALRNYPPPLIELKQGRERVLNVYKTYIPKKK